MKPARSHSSALRKVAKWGLRSSVRHIHCAGCRHRGPVPHLWQGEPLSCRCVRFHMHGQTDCSPLFTALDLQPSTCGTPAAYRSWHSSQTVLGRRSLRAPSARGPEAAPLPCMPCLATWHAQLRPPLCMPPGGPAQAFPLSKQQKFTDDVGRGLQAAQMPAHRMGTAHEEPRAAPQVRCGGGPSAL